MTRDEAISAAMVQLAAQLQVSHVDVLEVDDSNDGWVVLTADPDCSVPMWVHVPEGYAPGDEVDEAEPYHFADYIDDVEPCDEREPWDDYQDEGFGSVETEPHWLRATRSR